MKAEEALVSVTNQFVQEHLGPRARQVAVRTRTIVEKELSSNIRDASALIIAIEQSERVRRIERLDYSVTSRPERGLWRMRNVHSRRGRS